MSQLEAVAAPKLSMASASGVLQRKCDGCKKKSKGKGLLQRTAVRDDPVMDVPPIVHEVLRTPGQPLDAKTREFMEPRFGQDFSRVRVHTDARAAESARAVNALAYTVGQEVVFGAGHYMPETRAGQTLVAHELTHVIQQAGGSGNNRDLVLDPPSNEFEQFALQLSNRVVSGKNGHVGLGAGTLVQRDLATPVPLPVPGTQRNLTEAEIREAIDYNRSHYDAANTRIIQEMLGGPVTGTWTRDNITAIAETQEEYGLQKDGRVGPHTFRFIVREQELGRIGLTDENCLVRFGVDIHPVQTSRTPGYSGTGSSRRDGTGSTVIMGHHTVSAQFSRLCDCSRYQYRQEIRGVAGVRTALMWDDRNEWFIEGMGEPLPRSFREDRNIRCAEEGVSVRYGYRDQPMQRSTSPQCGENRYFNDDGVTDPAGCNYRGEDFPDVEVTGLSRGQHVILRFNFRGIIERDGREVQAREWTTVNEDIETP